MARVAYLLALISVVGFASAARPLPYSPSYPVYIVPEHRSTELRPLKSVEELPYGYDFQIVPADEYEVAVAEDEEVLGDTSIVSSIISSIWGVVPVPSPFAAIKTIVSKLFSVAKWVMKKGSLVLLGVALVVGFCAFTPFCTLVIEKPFAKHFQFPNIPYLDDAQHYFKQAYDKYHELY